MSDYPVARLGHQPAPTTRPQPVRIVAVEFVTEAGDRIAYPCSPPARLFRPPTRVELISGKAFVTCD